ncbi:MAG TPA: hypothetical protein VG964_01560 [Candidatus Saccharimonadales bacterium]|nr:hypothetical protein [Candidatus Saccharimonadales bacterium]
MLPDGSLIGRNPYEMFPQISVICRELRIELGDEPTEDEIQMLFDTLGKGKVYGENAEQLEIDDKIYDNLVIINGIDEMLIGFAPRSVHGADGPTSPVVVLGTGATANWMVRRAAEAQHRSNLGLEFTDIYLVGGNRPMEDKAGPPNVFVLEYMEENEGQLPTEWQVLVNIWHHRFGQWHEDVVHDSNDLDANIVALAQKYPHLATAKIYAPFNAAAVDKAIQVRAQLKSVFPAFDSNPEDPQFFFSSDSFPVATSTDEASRTAVYQRPKTFLSAIPRYVKQLHELTA